MPLLILLIAVPLIEIALFVTVGDAIGLWATLGIVLATGVAGAMLLRSQGQATLMRAQRPTSPEELKTALTDGAMLFTAGLLMLTPGFFTDAIGFALLAPPFRRWLANALARRATVVMRSGAAGPGRRSGPQADPTRQARQPQTGDGAADGRRSPWSEDDIEDAVELRDDDERR